MYCYLCLLRLLCSAFCLLSCFPLLLLFQLIPVSHDKERIIDNCSKYEVHNNQKDISNITAGLHKCGNRIGQIVHVKVYTKL